MSFRDNLLHLRASSNMTQEQLAMMLGVSRQSVTKWESERTYPEMDKLLKICQIFNCSLDDLVQGDLTNTVVHSTVSGSNTPPADVFGYDEHMRNFARRISNGVMAIILAVGVSILFLSWSESCLFGFRLSDNMSAAIGVLCIFIGIIVGLSLIIPAMMQHSAFVKAHPYVEDFYTEEEKTQARATFSFELIGGIGTILLGICILVFLSDTAYEGTIGLPLMMICIAVGVRLIIHGGIVLSRTNLEEYNRNAWEMLEPAEIERANVSEEQRRKMMKTHKIEKRIGAVCGTIMITATIIALLMLFLPLASGSPDYAQGPIALFWLPWPIGGMLCGIAALVIRSHDEE